MLWVHPIKLDQYKESGNQQFKYYQFLFQLSSL